MEAQEGPRQGVLEIEAPEFLAYDQNLFDQPPFSNATTALQNKLSFNPVVSLNVLSAMVRDDRGNNARNGVYPTETPTKGFELKNRGEQESVIAILASGVRTYSNDRLSNPLITKAVKVIVQELYPYPYWGYYLGVRMHGGEYYHDGRPQQKANFHVPVESYAKWVTDKLRREDALKMRGIEEVFTDTSHLMSGKDATRKWKILKASEIVRPR